ncbi:UPF0104 family protein [Microvirga tunisiensis]|uniref:UPF0104 family protein n=1 Tax=Pannonibacter tanglangensis TaxID=2750084 RepID=A0A7X5F1G1_9HYPH|nr:lysylphosphatidylglycerol synthase transmembrane domain-containing protein [Pannonibacter sp. XCT-53]NBN76719.1 UPF0104 family protein [Pannonibacter sp. XCT-53]
MTRLKLAALIASLAIVALLIMAVDPDSLLAALERVPAGHALAGLALVQVQTVLSALRWRYTARRLGHPMGLGRAVADYYMGSGLNQLLPGGVAGDAARIYRSGQDHPGGWKRAATTVVLERLSGQLAFFLLTGVGLLAWPLVLAREIPLPMSLPPGLPGGASVGAAPAGDGGTTAAGLLTGGTAAAGLLTGGAILVAVLLAGLVILFRRRLAALGPDLRAAFWSDGAWLVQLGLSGLIVATYVAIFLIASDAVGAPLPPVAALTAIPLCLLTMLIPVGIGGWGTREAAAAALWPLFGFTAAEGVAASLVYGLLSLAGTALPGGLILVAALLARLRAPR